MPKQLTMTMQENFKSLGDAINPIRQAWLILNNKTESQITPNSSKMKVQDKEYGFRQIRKHSAIVPNTHICNFINEKENILAIAMCKESQATPVYIEIINASEDWAVRFSHFEALVVTKRVAKPQEFEYFQPSKIVPPYIDISKAPPTYVGAWKAQYKFK